MVNRAALDHGENRIPIAFGIAEPLEQHHRAPFAAAIAIGRRVKGLAAAIGGERLHLRERNVREGREDQIHPTGQG